MIDKKSVKVWKFIISCTVIVAVCLQECERPCAGCWWLFLCSRCWRSPLILLLARHPRGQKPTCCLYSDWDEDLEWTDEKQSYRQPCWNCTEDRPAKTWTPPHFLFPEGSHGLQTQFALSHIQVCYSDRVQNLNYTYFHHIINYKYNSWMSASQFTCINTVGTSANYFLRRYKRYSNGLGKHYFELLNHCLFRLLCRKWNRLAVPQVRQVSSELQRL